MYCSNCGAADQDNNFCSACGHGLKSHAKKTHASDTLSQLTGKGPRLDTSNATKSLVWLGVYVLWLIIWIIGFANSARALGYFDKTGFAIAMAFGFIFPAIGAIYGFVAWSSSSGKRGARGYAYLLTCGIIGTVLNVWLAVGVAIDISQN